MHLKCSGPPPSSHSPHTSSLPIPPQEAVTWKSSRKLQEKAHDKTVVDRSMQRQEYCQDAEKSAEAQKREYLKSVMEENKRLAEERRREADRRKVADQERERQEVSFWDRTPRSFR